MSTGSPKTGSPNLVSLTLVAPMSQKFQSFRGGRTAARFFFANGCEAPAARHSPAAPARHSLQPAKPAPAPKVCQRCCPRSIADRVFFHHSHALPSILLWQQDCPFNPAVATGLLHPILPWQQDCPFNPAVATGLLHPILLWQQDCPFNPAVVTGLLHPFLRWQQDCPGASRAARAWNCSSPSAGL